MPTVAIVLQEQSLLHHWGPSRDPSLAQETETSSLYLEMMGFSRYFGNDIPNSLVYFETPQCPPEVPIKQMFKGMTCFHTGMGTTAIYFCALGFGLRFPSSIVLVYGVAAQERLLLRRQDVKSS